MISLMHDCCLKYRNVYMKDENNHKLGDQFKKIYIHNNEDYFYNYNTGLTCAWKLY